MMMGTMKRIVCFCLTRLRDFSDSNSKVILSFFLEYPSSSELFSLNRRYDCLVHDDDYDDDDDEGVIGLTDVGYQSFIMVIMIMLMMMMTIMLIMMMALMMMIMTRE